jgi:hypothetical protein
MQGVRRSHKQRYGDDEQRRSAPVPRIQKGKLLVARS